MVLRVQVGAVEDIAVILPQPDWVWMPSTGALRSSSTENSPTLSCTGSLPYAIRRMFVESFTSGTSRYLAITSR